MSTILTVEPKPVSLCTNYQSRTSRSSGGGTPRLWTSDFHSEAGYIRRHTRTDTRVIGHVEQLTGYASTHVCVVVAHRRLKRLQPANSVHSQQPNNTANTGEKQRSDLVRCTWLDIMPVTFWVDC